MALDNETLKVLREVAQAQEILRKLDSNNGLLVYVPDITEASYRISDTHRTEFVERFGSQESVALANYSKTLTREINFARGEFPRGRYIPKDSRAYGIEGQENLEESKNLRSSSAGSHSSAEYSP